MVVEDLSRFKSDSTPVMIEEKYEIEETYHNRFVEEEDKHDPKSEDHLFILAHGFMGGPHDMWEIKNEIAMVVPNAIFMASAVNAGKGTKNDIELLGKRLANEVIDFMRDEEQE